MNLLLLLAALLPWARFPLELFTRFFIAVSVLSVEMQLVTLSGIGSLYTLPLANVVVALLLIGMQLRTGRPAGVGWLSAFRPSAPWIAVTSLGAVVLLLNATQPLEAADPYHLERIAQIERLGTLAYDPAAVPKVNVLGCLYELVWADIRQIPYVGAGLMRMHGVLDLIVYGVTIAAVFTLLGSGTFRWPLLALFVIPPVFHQLVLIKNDLFVAGPAFVALAWLISTSCRAHASACAGIPFATEPTSTSWREAAWAGWLVGLVVGYKLTNLPLALVMVVGVMAATRGRDWRPLAGLALGGVLGIVASGLLLTAWENARWYGDPFASGPVADIGNRTTSAAEAVTSVARFGISLFDLGLLTPRLWPGRGHWGGNFGLPFIWAVSVLILSWRSAREARLVLTIVAFHFIAFSAIFPDADLSHRLALAPALLVVAVAVYLVNHPSTRAARARIALVPVLVLSGAQIARSALLYMTRA